MHAPLRALLVLSDERPLLMLDAEDRAVTVVATLRDDGVDDRAVTVVAALRDDGVDDREVAVVGARLEARLLVLSEGTGEGARLAEGGPGRFEPGEAAGPGEPARAPKAPLIAEAAALAVACIGRPGFPIDGGRLDGVKLDGIGGALRTLCHPGGGGPLPVHFLGLASASAQASLDAAPKLSFARRAAVRRALSTAAASSGSPSKVSTAEKLLILDTPAALSPHGSCRRTAR